MLILNLHNHSKPINYSVKKGDLTTVWKGELFYSMPKGMFCLEAVYEYGDCVIYRERDDSQDLTNYEVTPTMMKFVLREAHFNENTVPRKLMKFFAL